MEKYIKEAMIAPNNMFADLITNISKTHEVSMTSQIKAQSLV